MNEQLPEEPRLTRTKSLALVGLAVVLIVVALILWRPFGFSSPSGTVAKPTPPPERVVHFPEDRPIGVLTVRDWSSTGRKKRWVFLALAQGTVTVPLGKELKLGITTGSRVQDLSFLAEIGENDLQSLELSGGVKLSPSISGQYMSNSTLTDRDLRFIRGLRSLRELDLRGAKISDAGIMYLRSLTQLERLDLRFTRITDNGLAYLRSIRSLKFLDLTDTRITPDGLASLKQAFPDCQVVYWVLMGPPSPTPTSSTQVPLS